MNIRKRMNKSKVILGVLFFIVGLTLAGFVLGLGLGFEIDGLKRAIDCPTKVFLNTGNMESERQQIFFGRVVFVVVLDAIFLFFNVFNKNVVSRVIQLILLTVMVFQTWLLINSTHNLAVPSSYSVVTYTVFYIGICLFAISILLVVLHTSEWCLSVTQNKLDEGNTRIDLN
jgi:hypothetical protein